MKSTLALAVVLAALAVICDSSVIKANTKANLNVGYVSSGDRMIARTYVYRPPMANTIQYEDMIIRGNITNRITAVQATEVGATQYASAWIVGGGLGWNNVTIRFQSYRGYGYYYLLDVWAR